MKKSLISLASIALVLAACSSDDNPTSAGSGDVVGNWAGNYSVDVPDGSSVNFVVSQKIKSDMTYDATVSMGSTPLHKEQGNWKVVGTSFITTGTQCQQADITPNLETGTLDVGSLKLVACEGSDTTSIQIKDGKWTVNTVDEDGVHTFTMNKL